MKAKKLPLAELNRERLADKLPLSYPMSVTIEPSSVCNFRCIYCAHSLGHKGFTESHFQPMMMTWELFTEAVSQLKQFPEKSKRLHLFRNGESLLNPLLPKMISHIKKNNITEHINIITNASLLTPELSLQLIESGLDTLCVSLQGLDDKTYHDVTGSIVSFEHILKNIHFFFENKKSCNLFVKIADITITEKNEWDFYHLFSDISDRINIESICPVYPSVDYNGIIKQHGVNRHGELLTVPRVCQIPFYHLHILADGTIFYCNSIDSPVPTTNILDKSLVSIWNSKERNDFLKKNLVEGYEHNPTCCNCRRFAQELRHEDNIDNDAVNILHRMTVSKGDF